jgi:SAM-dependent methyltransferase
MKYTSSGEYKLPGTFSCLKGNMMLRMAGWVPKWKRDSFVRERASYQVFDGTDLGDREGLSIKKWEAMRMPSSLVGKSVLDIGCSEGFFCRQCAKIGAGPVLGMDTSLGRLMCASFISMQEGLRIRYRMDVFPSKSLRSKFNYVICLSVLHHSLAKKDVWKVLTDDKHASDLAVLRDQFRVLRSLTAERGKCIIEMPYEYDDPDERNQVDFERFSKELIGTGFTRAQSIGSWDYNPKYRDLKDRIIYVAEA